MAATKPSVGVTTLTKGVAVLTDAATGKRHATVYMTQAGKCAVQVVMPDGQVVEVASYDLPANAPVLMFIKTGSAVAIKDLPKVEAP